MRALNKLTEVGVAEAKKPGLYGDGDGLWLRVDAKGNKSWVLRYMISGRARSMGLGPIKLVSLAEARQRAGERRKLILDGIDPIDDRTAQRQRRIVAARREESMRAAIDAITKDVLDGIGPLAPQERVFVFRAIEPIFNGTDERVSRSVLRLERSKDECPGRTAGERRRNFVRIRDGLVAALPKLRLIQRRFRRLKAEDYPELVIPTIELVNQIRRKVRENAQNDNKSRIT